MTLLYYIIVLDNSSRLPAGRQVANSSNNKILRLTAFASSFAKATADRQDDIRMSDLTFDIASPAIADEAI